MPFFDSIRIGASGAADTAYTVDRSLKFNTTEQTVLTKTLSTSPTNRKKTTLSFWFKKSKLSTAQGILTSGASGTGGSTNGTRVYLNADDTIKVTTQVSNATVWEIDTNRKFRDPSAWIHFCMSLDTTQSTASDRVKIYFNGVQETSFSSASYPSQDYNDIWAYSNYRIGDWGGDYGYYVGYQSYIAEVITIDGQALDPSSFTETDATTGQLVPKDPSDLTFGTNGFHLKFADNSGTTSTTLGKDSSGNGNNFTPYNFSVSAGVGNDSVIDTPTNNFCTFNPLKKNISTPVSYTEGNLQYNGVSGNNYCRSSTTIPVSSGKWYAEFKMVSGYSATDPTLRIGIITSSAGHRDSNNDGLYYENTNNAVSVNYGAGGAVYVSNTSQITGLTTYTNNDVLGIALDLDNDKFFVSKNGTFFSNGTGTQDPAAGTNPLYSGGVITSRKSEGFEIAVQAYSDKVITADFGQQGFAYTPPAGFKAICTANFPDPAILFPNKHFGTILYTGTGSSRSVSNSSAVDFTPDWIWVKKRSGSEAHDLQDTVRGATKRLSSNTTDAEITAVGSIDSFISNGFTTNDAGTTNESGFTYAAWNWNAGDTDGKTYTVTVVSDSGNKYRFDGFGTSAVTLDLAEGGTYIFNMDDSSNASHPFSIGTAANGTVYTSGITYFLDGVSKTYSEYTSGFSAASTRRLHITVPASAPVLYYWCSVHSGMGGQINTNSTLGSSNFDGSIQSTVKVNATAGFSIVKYTGNATGGATFGHGLGVKPTAVILKRRDSGGSNWYLYQHKVNSGSNPEDYYLELNSNSTQSSSTKMTNGTSPTSTVFTLSNDGDVNASSGTYVAYCLSEVFQYSKHGSYVGNGNSDGAFVFTPFKPSFVLIKATTTSENWRLFDNKRNTFNQVNKHLIPSTSGAESTETGLDFVANGFKFRDSDAHQNGSGHTYIYLAFADSPFKNARAR